MVEIQGRRLTSGKASGNVLKLDEPVSFWGGVGLDGKIIDVHHPQHGELVSGRVLVMKSGRGSSSGTYSFAELIRSDLAPAAIVMTEPDAIVSLGALVAAEMYDKWIPIVMVDGDNYDRIIDGSNVEIVTSLGEEATITSV
ncbi:MAG: DUF126 domain-containing protein [Actinobacteria bacterium]|uniref:Unannotated protein n=1 Tax=freshwater metagenome TaxID=449393 RepID=A0A6J5ZJT5_9ZZZZ|nr:DUF126 domain-containing protein [Actinomycetota bacterium]